MLIVLQVLLDSSVTSAVMHWCDGAKKYVINTENLSLISDVRIIVDMLLSWRAWEESADDVWLMAFHALNSLVRTDHPHRNYNIEQLCRAGVICKLLDICKVTDFAWVSDKGTTSFQRAEIDYSEPMTLIRNPCLLLYPNSN